MDKKGLRYSFLALFLAFLAFFLIYFAPIITGKNDTGQVSITILPSEVEENISNHGIFEPLCCNDGVGGIKTGDWCIENNVYNETTGEGDIYCEGEEAGENILVNVQHILKFNFSSITVGSNDVLECVIEQSNESMLIINETGLTLNNDNYLLEYAISNKTNIERDESGSIHDLPWGVHNCSVIYNAGGRDIYDLNDVIFVHRNLKWTTFDYQKAVFAESVPFKFFNNTLALKKPYIENDYKSYMRYLTFKHYAGSQTEEFCFDGKENDGDLLIDYDDKDCRTFAHRYNSSMNYTIPGNFLSSLVFFKNIFSRARITGKVFSTSEDDNIVVDSLGGTNYWYTLNTDLDGSFKVRIYETSPGSSGYGYTIKGFPNVSSIAIIGGIPSAISSSYACGEPAGYTDNTCNINLDCSSCGDEFTDIVLIVNSSDSDYDSQDNFELETVHGTSIETESFSAYFDNSEGLNNTFENETSLAVNGNNLCTDSMNNDLDISTDYDYINGLSSSTNRITWSRDCADVDCDGTNGPSYTAEQDYTFSQGQCEYLIEQTCGDGYDNDFNDNYTTDAYGMQGYYYTDCHDADCFSNGDGLGTCPTSETVCNDGLNNDWDYVDTDSESASGHKIGNTDNDASNGASWNDLKYHHLNRQVNLIDCEDPDCNTSVGGSSGEICEWAHELTCNDGFNNDALQTYDCGFNGVLYGTVNDNAPDYSHAEYDCASYCRTNEDNSETATQCDDGIDNDWDYYDNSGIYSGSALSSGGIDCGWNGSGKNYNPDLDCNGETMDNGYTCEIGIELTCDDSFDNDYDNKASDASTRGAEWDSTLYEDYFGSGTYSKNADCDDYDCQGNANCPTNEAENALWCFDGADNDLDGDVDCSDSDCVGITNPDDVTEKCFPYELNASLLLDLDVNTSSVSFCGNNKDDENKDDDNAVASGDVFNYNSIGFTYTGSRISKMDCNDLDCRQNFGQCAPCSNNELVEWNSCFDGKDNDHDGNQDNADSDCDGQIVDARGYNATNGPTTEISCMNNYDDDNDGDVDCDDSDCIGQVFSPDGRVCLECGSGSEQGSTNCSDGYDNDGDGDIDCYDEDCNTECGIDLISGSGITHSPKNTSFTLTGDVTISGTATEIVRKGGDLYVSYSYSGGNLGGITIVLGSYATGEVIDTNVFDVANAVFVSNPDSFSIDRTYANNGYLTFSRSGISSFSFKVKIPGKSVLDESSTIRSTAEIGTKTASGSFDTEVVNNQSPSIDVLEIEPSTGKLTVQDKIQVIAGNFTGYSGGQSNSGGEGRCRIQISGPNGFSIDEYRNDCQSSNGNNYKITSSGTYSVSVTPYDNTGNEGTALTDNINLQVAPKITLGLRRADTKRVFMASNNDNFDSFGDEYNSKLGTMLATFETDVNNAFTSNACTATIWEENGNFVSSDSITADLRNNGQELVCVVDSDLTGVTSDGLYRITVNATDSQGYSLKTSELVFFNCNDLTSASGHGTWNCSLADFDVDGYTEGIYLPFRYDDGAGGLTNFACDSCPEVTNTGKDADGDGFDNACDPICGDGYVEGNEECDDGNLIDGDGCSSNCRLEEEEEEGAGGGGGAAAEEEEEEEEIIEEEIEFMSAFPDPIEVQIRQGQTKTKTFAVKNNLDQPLSLEIDYSGVLEEFMFISKEDLEIELAPYESKEIRMEIFANEEVVPDVYEGQIMISSNRGIYNVNMFIEVKAKEALFDVETTMIDKVISAGEDAVAQIKITDVGDLGMVEAELYYDVRDFNNNTLAFANETITINGNLTLVRGFNIPENVTERDYLFYSRVTYEGLIATSADSFIVGAIEGTILLWVVALILLILILIVIIIIYRNNFYEMWRGIKYKMYTE